MELAMKQVQHQVLTPQMELSVRILQMDSQQLTDYIKEVMLENPVMEIEQPYNPDSKEEVALRKLQWLEDQTRKEKENVGYYDEEADDFPLEKTAAAATGENLADYLMRQASLNVSDVALLPVVRQVICCLDDNGYLDAPDDEICEKAGCTPEMLEQAVQMVQGFEPAGVCARSLGECLSLQLAPEDTLARRLAMECLEEIAKNSHRAQLAKRLGATVEEVDTAIARIRRLNPKPGSMYGIHTVPAYITPDVVVTAFENQYHVMLCEFTYPEIRLSQSYLRMAKETDDKEVVSYIGNKVNQINWIKKCIESRNETLLAVAKAIVKKQEYFFRYGPQYLNILRMRDIAEIVGLHESTVSRAVRDKYLQCAHGIYPLRHFFVKGVEGGEDNAVSSHNIKWELKRLIAEEDPAKPLSDQQITDLLAGQGMELSRRTVAKYREEMGIAKSSMRAVR